MVTLAQIKQALKIDYSTDDAELLRLRDAVVSHIENYTGLTIETAKKTQYCSYWMRTRLDGFPYSSIDSIKYTNTSNVLTTMPSTDYWVDRSDEPSVYVNFLEYPSIKEGTNIQINYTAGYADTPKDIEQAIIAFIGAWYNNPEALAPINMQVVPISAQFILDNLRVRSMLT